MPLMPTLAATCAFSWAASARLATGPTRTRLSEPLSVLTCSTKALKPLAPRVVQASRPEWSDPVLHLMVALIDFEAAGRTRPDHDQAGRATLHGQLNLAVPANHEFLPRTDRQ